MTYLTYPEHYRDGENRGLCPWSGTVRENENVPCPNGCAGAKEHYANDGHKECAE